MGFEKGKKTNEGKLKTIPVDMHGNIDIRN